MAASVRPRNQQQGNATENHGVISSGGSGMWKNSRVYDRGACSAFDIGLRSRCQNNSRILKDELKRFVICLKSYIYETTFDAKGFEADIENLSASLVNISELVMVVSPTPSLDNQLRFTTVMFRSMIAAAGKLKAFHFEKQPGFRFIHKVVEIGIRCFVMFDSNGRLDTRIDSYVGELNRLRGSLVFWRGKFFNLRFVSSYVLLVFEAEFDRAIEALKYLTQQVPVMV